MDVAKCHNVAEGTDRFKGIVDMCLEYVKTLAREEYRCENWVPDRGPINRTAKSEAKHSTRSTRRIETDEERRRGEDRARRMIKVCLPDQRSDNNPEG